MNSKNSTELKKQIEWVIKYWLSKQVDYEELNFFYNYELHQDEFSDFVMSEICKKIHELKKSHHKQTYTRQRYARDGFYTSDAWKEETHKVKNMKDEDRYKVHKVNF